MKYATHRNSQTASNGNNTKRAAKRRKMRKRSNSDSIRKPDPIKQIYQTVTESNMARVADKETEERLSSYGPPSTVRNATFKHIW